jgi:5'-methylthioadenosine phosphorylase
VTVEAVMRVMAENVGRAKALVRAAIPRIGEAACAICDRALATAVLTQRAAIAPSALRRLAPMLAKYFPAEKRARRARAASSRRGRRR